MNLTIVLKLLSDKNRLRIVNLLNNKSLCVGEIQTILGLMQSNTSRHLEKLSSNNLITSYKESQMVFYFLNKEFLNEYSNFFDFIVEKIGKDRFFKTDLNRLNRYINSNFTCDDLRKVGCNFDKLNI